MIILWESYDHLVINVTRVSFTLKASLAGRARPISFTRLKIKRNGEKKSPRSLSLYPRGRMFVYKMCLGDVRVAVLDEQGVASAFLVTLSSYIGLL